jgi:hypothetical protein
LQGPIWRAGSVPNDGFSLIRNLGELGEVGIKSM